MKSAASAMYGSIKKGNPNVIGEGIKAAASGYAESKANREAKKKSENSGKGITIANYGVANLSDVNNKLSKVMNINSTKQASIGALGAVGIGSLGVGTLGPQTIGASIPSIIETIGSVGASFTAPQVAVMAVVASAVLLALSGQKVGQTEDEEKAAVEAANQKKKNDKGDTAEEKSEDKLPNQGIVRGNIKEAPPVDAGKQGKHVTGHNNNNPSKSQWPEGENGVDKTQEAWQNGEMLPDGTKVWDSGKPIGTNGETGVRVHIDGNGNIHGYPVDPSQYLK